MLGVSVRPLELCSVERVEVVYPDSRPHSFPEGEALHRVEILLVERRVLEFPIDSVRVAEHILRGRVRETGGVEHLCGGYFLNEIVARSVIRGCAESYRAVTVRTVESVREGHEVIAN